CSLAMFVDARNGGNFAGICRRRFPLPESPPSPCMGQVRSRPSTEGAGIAPERTRPAPRRRRDRRKRQKQKGRFPVSPIVRNVASGFFKCAELGNKLDVLGPRGAARSKDLACPYDNKQQPPGIPCCRPQNTDHNSACRG